MIKKLFFVIGGGAISFYTELAITILLTEIFGFGPEISYFIAIVIGLVMLFYIYRNKAFKVKTNPGKQLFRFFILYVIYYIVNWLAVVFLINFMKYFLAIVIVNIITWPWTFLINNYWVFRKTHRRKLNIFKEFKRDFSDEWKRFFPSHRRINNSDDPKDKN